MTNNHAWHGFVLAGGDGLRAKPATLAIPKALLPFLERTIIEVLIDQMRSAGVSTFTISVGYLANHVEGYLRLARPDLDLTFERESKRLGTAGSIVRVSTDVEHLLVCNCDIFTDLDFTVLMNAHLTKRADITILGAYHSHQVPFGKLEMDNEGRLIRWTEKPDEKVIVSTGIYAIERRVLRLLQRDEFLDMPDLILRALSAGDVIRVFIHNGVWHDIGSLQAYDDALKAFESNLAHRVP